MVYTCLYPAIADKHVTDIPSPFSPHLVYNNLFETQFLTLDPSYPCQSSPAATNPWMVSEFLLNWCIENDLYIDPRICVCDDQIRGIHIVSRNEPIPPNVTLVRIPKSAVLSVKSCSISKYIPFELHGWDAQLGLSFALYSEFLRGESSRWFGYLRSLPSVDLPVFWACYPLEKQSGVAWAADSDFDDPLLWLQGTEVSKRLGERNGKGQTMLEAIDHYYWERVLPVLQQPDIHRLLREEPALIGFHQAFSLVSSRAFLLDVYHGLAMTPIADAFNHVIENHVHIQSDFYVCPECGSLRECEHDDTHLEYALKSTDENLDHDRFYEMVSNADIPPNEEVFNTYGEKLSNAELLVQYGFILDPNDNDVVRFEITEIARLFPSLQNHSPMPPLSDPGFASFSELFATSTLAFVQNPPSVESTLCIDSDGRISHQLWILLLQLLCRSTAFMDPAPRLSEDELIEVAAFQIHVENSLQRIRSELEEQEGNDELHITPESPGPWAKVLSDLAHMVVRLCNNKKTTIGHPKDESQDFGESLDTIPEDKKRLKLAVSVAMSECSILDSYVMAVQYISEMS